MQLTARIIYPLDDGIAVVIPSGELPIEDVAAKDVPAGTPYLLIDASDLPTDRTFRAAWTADFSAPDGYGIGADAWFAARAAQARQPTPPEPPDSPEADLPLPSTDPAPFTEIPVEEETDNDHD
jgi:hypothetical protein